MEDQEPCHPLPVLLSPSRPTFDLLNLTSSPHPKLGGLVGSQCPSSDPPSLGEGVVDGERRRQERALGWPEIPDTLAEVGGLGVRMEGKAFCVARTEVPVRLMSPCAKSNALRGGHQPCM